MARPRLTFDAEAFNVEFPGLAAFAAARRRVRVPYGDVASVAVDAPEWSPPFTWRVGSHLPLVMEMGSFRYRGRKRINYFTRRTTRALVVRLRPGARWTDLTLDLEEPGTAATELRMRLASAGQARDS